MATSKTLELSIKIAGRMDKSLTAAINGTQSKIGSLTKSISNIGTVGLATMGAVATAAAVGIAGCTKEAQALESAMAPVVRYVDGLADASGAVSDAIADNGKTFKQNYGALKTYIQDLSTEIPRTTDQLTAMSAALGQSGIGVDQQLTTGYLRDTAVTATAMDLDDQTAGNYVAKWEASFNFDHKQVMELMDQINYLGAHNATTAAEIAQSVNSAASMGQIAGVDPAATAAMATAMDDVIILGQDKETLHRWKAAVETFLQEELALDLNSKTSIRPVRQGVEFVGVRIWPTHMKLRKSTVRRIKREVRKISALYAAGDMTRQDFYRRIASIRGLLKHTESASLRWRLNEIYRAELEKAKQKQLREEAQYEPFADHSGAGNGDGNAGTGYQDHGNPACRAG